MALSLPQLATYLSYVLIILLYARKIRKVAGMPRHLRWELYPVVTEKNYRYGGSYFEEPEWWTIPQRKMWSRAVVYLLKKYLFFGGYYRRDRAYWLGLFPWHTGFYLIVTFHILSFFGALAGTVAGLVIAADSASFLGRALYYLTLGTAAGSFVTGAFGSAAMLVKRLADPGLRAYASLQNYFNYLFFLAVFLSGLAAWAFHDPTLAGYREFWSSLITFKYMSVEPLAFIHIMLFSLFLMYLPFTRSTHYITKLFAYFGVRWDDRPNLKGSGLDPVSTGSLTRPVSWAAPHIQSGKSWGEVVRGLPEANGTDEKA
ncbi:MAG: respiratory nitrate reductase subunit gamma [Chloroflexi bacterium]|nr:respiratory nitrate reductase subunit gamma [Chloroflexota bacterium]